MSQFCRCKCYIVAHEFMRKRKYFIKKTGGKYREQMDLFWVKNNWTNTMNNDVSASIASWDSVADGYVYNNKNCLKDDPFFHLITEKIPLQTTHLL